MQFHITRNGQTYGPYTRQDLERYVSTGNVLPTDMGKSDEMTQWMLVSEILAGRLGMGTETSAASQQTPAADPASPFASQPAYTQPGYSPNQPGYQQQNPYGQPAFPQPPNYGNAAYPGYPTAGIGAIQANSAYPDPPSMSWGIVLLIDVFTCGLFQLFWNINMALWLKKVRPSTIPLYCYIGVAVLGVLGGAISVGSNYQASSGSTNYGLLGASLVSGLLVFIVKLFARFSFRNELEAQYGPGGPENIGIDVNPVMVFFFGGLYLQSHLSRIAELKAAARMQAMQQPR